MLILKGNKDSRDKNPTLYQAPERQLRHGETHPSGLCSALYHLLQKTENQSGRCYFKYKDLGKKTQKKQIPSTKENQQMG